MSKEPPDNKTADQLPSVNVRFIDWGIRLGNRTILAGINLHLDGPGVTVLMGPAGTGKSTLLRSLAGQRSAHASQQGQILVNGLPVGQTANPPALAQQHPRELELSVIALLIAAQRSNDQPLTPIQMRQKAMATLEALDRHELLARLESRLFDLPRGLMRQALIIRAAMTGNPVLLIDEPTADLDDAQASAILSLITRLSARHACLVTLHNQAQARILARDIILLAGGTVQVSLPAPAFFLNPENHPVLAQFLRTGSCCLPSPDSSPDQLDPDAFDSLRPVPALPGQSVGTPPPDSSSTDAPVETPVTVVPASRGPNGFHWLIPGKLGGCPMPGAILPLEHDLVLLRNLGVTVLVNVTEHPMTQTAIPAAGLRTIHMGVEDRDAPPLMWMKMLLVKIDRMISQGEVVAVHCLAGLGRTGTVLGSWLVREGLTADEALRRLRSIEPRYVQSKVQEQLLHDLEHNLLLRVPNH